MIFEQIALEGGDRNYAYLVADEATREAAIVDPGYDGKRLVDMVKERGLNLMYVLNTHPHGDHSGDNAVVTRATGAQLAAFGQGDVPLKDGDVLALGALELRIIHTPGHTPDDICILVEGKLITGDTLFVGKVGGTDFGESARIEFESLHRLLDMLDDEVEVWPGHNYGVRPSSTIGAERRENPFLLRTDFEDFLWLKKNWLQYKEEHGIK
jgi:glyoxylase-like metal-dependent hydrolase (beta-lactamase superfamily II)